MDDATENLFWLFFSTWRAVLWDYLGLKQVTAWKKRSRSYLQRRKIKKQRQKELFTAWECLNYKKSSQQLPSCVICIATRLAVLQNVFAIILLWARKDVEKLFEETVYKWDKEKRKKERRNIAFGTLKMSKLAQMFQQSSGTRQVCVSVFFLFWSLYKTNRFHVAVGLFSNRSQKTSKWRNDTLDTSLLLPHLDVICHQVENFSK